MNKPERITWRFMRPPPKFSCMCCMKETAEWRRKVGDLNLSLGDRCVRKTDSEILAEINQKGTGQ